MNTLFGLVVLAVLLGVPVYVIGERRGVKNAWAGFIPGIGPAIVLLWSIRRSGWLVLCSFIPIVNLVFGIWLLFTVPATHRRSSLWGFGLMVPVVGVWAYAFTLAPHQSALTTWNLGGAGFEPPGQRKAPSYPAEASVRAPDPWRDAAPFPTTETRPLRPLIVFAAVVGVGLVLIAVGLRVTDHPAKASPVPVPLSRTEFVRAANSACLGAHRQLRQALKKRGMAGKRPLTLKVFAADLRIALPTLHGLSTTLNRLDPPRSDWAAYRLMLNRLDQDERGARSMLHFIETGQIRSAMLAARHVDVVERRQLPSFERKLGLTACVKATK